MHVAISMFSTHDAIRPDDLAPKSVTVSVFGVATEAAAVEEMQRIGVHRVILGLPSHTRDKVLPLLDRYVRLLPG